MYYFLLSADAIETNDFEFLSIHNGVLFTKDVNFNVSGNITVDGNVPVEGSRKRHCHSCWFGGHGPGLLFHGHGSHIHTHGSLFGHINPFHGFSHSCWVRFGYGHDHHHPAHLYISNTHSPNYANVALSYLSHLLTVRVKHGHKQYISKVQFNPTPNLSYQVTTSFR